MKKRKASILLKELIERPFPSEERQSEIVLELKQIIPDPMFMDHIYYSDDFVNKDGTFDYEGLIKKCFDDYEPNIIAL
ncbi:hypothetical protein [Pseudodesulfovibrio sediminis]|uniref:Uncharacterized protein n=1 Tax=Pseudodesulfovibrio sediminis TaxID=2810563 RepID=A0ABN6EUB4_9BACT|nr:hypothetical protein [Pseudodesulfovibrio sediminis]BCS88799.1 hypothetical protein PSDVSF_20410 [Pseudodesulfovibrio sediminis]